MLPVRLYTMLLVFMAPVWVAAGTTPDSTRIVPQKIGFINHIGIGMLRFVTGTYNLPLKKHKKDVKGLISEKSYGANKHEVLDVIEPVAGTPEKTAVVYIHGGGWVLGQKEIYYGPLAGFAKGGRRVFNLEYPLAPRNPHPGILLSLLKALNWIKANYPQTTQVHVIGDSAGGNLVTMLGILTANPALLQTYFKGLVYTGPAVKSITSLYGVFDRSSVVEDKFICARAFLRAYVGKRSWKTETPIAIPFVPLDFSAGEIKNMPALFIAAAGKDALKRSSAMGYAQFSPRFANVEYKVYDGAQHGFYVQGKKSKELQSDVAAFIDRQD